MAKSEGIGAADELAKQFGTAYFSIESNGRRLSAPEIEQLSRKIEQALTLPEAERAAFYLRARSLFDEAAGMAAKASPRDVATIVAMRNQLIERYGSAAALGRAYFTNNADGFRAPQPDLSWIKDGKSAALGTAALLDALIHGKNHFYRTAEPGDTAVRFNRAEAVYFGEVLRQVMQKLTTSADQAGLFLAVQAKLSVDALAKTKPGTKDWNVEVARSHLDGAFRSQVWEGGSIKKTGITSGENAARLFGANLLTMFNETGIGLKAKMAVVHREAFPYEPEQLDLDSHVAHARMQQGYKLDDREHVGLRDFISKVLEGKRRQLPFIGVGVGPGASTSVLLPVEERLAFARLADQVLSEASGVVRKSPEELAALFGLNYRASASDRDRLIELRKHLHEEVEAETVAKLLGFWPAEKLDDATKAAQLVANYAVLKLQARDFALGGEPKGWAERVAEVHAKALGAVTDKETYKRELAAKVAEFLEHGQLQATSEASTLRQVLGVP